MTRNRQNYVTFGLCSTHTQYRTKFTRLEERLIADLDMVRPEGVEPVSTWHVIPDPKEQAEPDVFPRGAPHSLAERAAFWHGMGRK
jgi:hypothetical protein